MSMVMGEPPSMVTVATPASDSLGYIKETAVPVKVQLAVAPAVVLEMTSPP